MPHTTVLARLHVAPRSSTRIIIIASREFEKHWNEKHQEWRGGRRWLERTNAATA